MFDVCARRRHAEAAHTVAPRTSNRTSRTHSVAVWVCPADGVDSPRVGQSPRARTATATHVYSHAFTRGTASGRVRTVTPPITRHRGARWSAWTRLSFLFVSHPSPPWGPCFSTCVYSCQRSTVEFSRSQPSESVVPLFSSSAASLQRGRVKVSGVVVLWSLVVHP